MKRMLFRRSKLLVTVVLLVALFAFSFVGETGAWLKHTSSADSTTMTKATTSALTFSGTWPKITIKNNTNIKVYVRVVMAVNYINDTANNWNGNAQWRLYLGESPRNASYKQNDGLTGAADYSFTLNSNWLRKDITEAVGSQTATYMVFYHKAPIAAGSSTNQLFDSFTGSDKTKTIGIHGKTLTMSMTSELLADAIQCETSGRLGSVDDCAATKAWGVTLASVGGNISAAPTSDAYVNP